VETRTLKEVQEVLDLLEANPQCGVTRIMLDNMTRLDPTLPGLERISGLSLLLHHACLIQLMNFKYVIVAPCLCLQGASLLPVTVTLACLFSLICLMLQGGHHVVACKEAMGAGGESIAVAGGVDVQMLESAMELISGHKVETEASGNVTLQTVARIASTGVAFISCGALTHSVTALDISLRIHDS
jgi:hypothetical protein